MDAILKDDRFAKIATDRKFRGGGKKQRKVKIDKRFESMFAEERFVSKCSVDKRGRPQNLTSKENYRKYYDLKDSDDSDSDSDSENESVGAEPKGEAEKSVDSNLESGDNLGSSSEESEESELDIEPSIKEKLRNAEIDYARGGGTLYSDSSSDESSEEEVEKEGFDKWGELDRDAERTEESTRRLALCNMDWDRVGADDIFLALSSFCPSAGSVKQVDIFLSEFGSERLAEEETLGPQELRSQGDQDEQEDDYTDLTKNKKKAMQAEKAAMERVREYQINRLKYYYAVVEFDSVISANSVYEECDGMEYELSATRFDLRFVPDDMQFGEPSSSCSSHPNQDAYQPKSFMTTALQQGTVELTWDEEDGARHNNIKKAYEWMDKDGDEDFSFAQNLIASSSSEDEEAEGNEEKEEDAISKYRSLLAGLGREGSQEDKGMEVSWVPEDDEAETEEQDLTPWQKYLAKKKEKKSRRKKANTAEDSDESEGVPADVDLEDPFFAEEMSDKKSKKKGKKKKKKVEVETETEEKGADLDLLVMDSDDDRNHFDYKTIVDEETKSKSKKKKWKKKKEVVLKPEATDSFDVNVNDDRFSAIFHNPDFNIDPSQQNFKKTSGMDKLISEKQKRVVSGTEPSAPKSKKSKLDPQLSASLKSVKNKWEKNAKKKSKP